MGSSTAHLNLRRIEMGDVDTSSSEEEAFSDVDESNIVNKKVIILGAGVAGISAALFLKKHNVEAVVLEGRDRIGGRIYTDYHSFSAPVDMGAFIITGADPDVSRNTACDPCGPISRTFGLGLHFLDSRRLPLYHPAYKQTPIPRSADTQSAALFDRLLDAVSETHIDKNGPDSNLKSARSLGTVFSQCLNEYVEKFESTQKSFNKNGTPMSVIGSTIEKQERNEEGEEIKGLSDSPGGWKQQQKRSTEIELEQTTTPKRDIYPSPVRKKLKITCKGQKDVVLDVFPTRDAVKSHMGTRGKTMSLSQLCPVEKGKLPQETDLIKQTSLPNKNPIELSSKDLEEKPKSSRRGRGRPRKIQPVISPRTPVSNGNEIKTPNYLIGADPEARIDVVMWHKAHLEYGCGTSLNHLSCEHWNQDEDYGGFHGRHAIVKGGLAPLVERLSIDLDIRLEMVVEEIIYGTEGVRVRCKSGEVFEGGCAICTLPLGVLKSQSVTFTPPLPPWKQTAIESIGFGNLNKVVLEFDEVFWDMSIDYFGIVPTPVPTTQQNVESQYDSAGFCFMWCTAFRYTEKPLMTGLVSGAMADKVEEMTDDDVIQIALTNLSSIFGDRVQKLYRHGKITRWKKDVFSGGCYTYIPVGMSARGYENLGHPILGHGFAVLFGGEHTNKHHPDTIGGAMITGDTAQRWRRAQWGGGVGVREGKRALHLLYGPDATKRKVQVPSVQRARDQDASELLFKEAEAEIVRSHRL